MNHAELLEKIADQAEMLRDLEREVVKTSDPRRVMDALNETRQGLDELLRERRARGR